MELKYAVLIAIIIILTIVCLRLRCNLSDNKACCANKQPPAAEQEAESPPPENMSSNYEKNILSENAEYFEMSGEPNQTDDTKASQQCVDDAFGGLSYTDFVTSKAINAETYEHHAEFVKDRKANDPNGGARMMMADAHDSYDPITWMGLRRPQSVPVDESSKSVVDVDYNLYANNRTLSW